MPHHDRSASGPAGDETGTPTALRIGPAARLTVYLKMASRWHHKPAYWEIVHRARAAGLAGASVFRGDEGFGRSDQIHMPRLLSLNGDLPCSVVIVDDEEKLRAFLPQVEEVLTEGVALLQPVEIVHYGGTQVRRA